MMLIMGINDAHSGLHYFKTIQSSQNNLIKHIFRLVAGSGDIQVAQLIFELGNSNEKLI